METLIQEANRALHEGQAKLGFLESRGVAESNDTEKEIQNVLQEVSNKCNRLDNYILKEQLHKRQAAKYRVDQVKFNMRQLESAVRHAVNRRLQREREEEEREELLNRRYTTNDESIYMDEAMQTNVGLHNANKEVDHMLLTGASVMNSLQSQRSTLKNAQKRILDIVTSLGMSNSVMRMIERRGKEDKVVLFSAMVLTCIVMFLVVHYLR